MGRRLNLESFLCGESSEQSLRGTGAFADSVALAHKRFQEFKIGDPESWVSKLVQAVSAWRARELQVTRNRASITFHFRPYQRKAVPSGTEIFRTLLHGDLSGSKGLERFCLAIRILREYAELAFLLILDNGQDEPMVVAEGKQFQSMNAAARLRPEYHRGPGISLVVSHAREKAGRFQSLRGGAREDVSEAVLGRLHRDSELANFQVVLDNQPIDALTSPAWEKITPNDLLALIGLPVTAPSNKSFGLPPALSPGLTGNSFWHGLCPKGEKWFGFVLMCCGVGQNWSQVSLVQDGIVLERLPLFGQYPLGYRVILDARGLATNPSGSAFVSSSGRQQLLREALEACLQRLRDVRSRRHELVPYLSRFFDQEQRALDSILGKSLDTAAKNFPSDFLRSPGPEPSGP